MVHNHPLELINHNVDVSKIDASVIWLHGLGADGYDFEPIVNQLLQPEYLPFIRFILPHAPEIAVTRNNGYIMPAWYDLYGITPVSKEDEAGIQASQHYINTLIQKEIHRGIPSNRIILAGFSQGGAIALYTALRYSQKLAGILALSTYMPLHKTLSTQAHTANASTPIFMAHGIFDEIITLEMSKTSRDLLQSCQYFVEWHEYPIAHSLCYEEIADIRSFLQQVLY
jgi:phospholipase/carboxylesterase